MAGASTQALVSRASDGAAGAKTRDPAQETTRGARHDIALRESCAGSRVSFRSRKSARCTRPGHEATAVATPRPYNPIHLSNSPSQRFALPLNLARGAAFLLFPFSPNGELGFNTILGLGCQSFAAGLGKKFHQGGRDLGLSNERDRAQTATPQPPPRNAGTIGATRLGRANGLPARGFPCLAARRWLHSGPPSGARVPSAAERWLSG